MAKKFRTAITFDAMAASDDTTISTKVKGDAEDRLSVEADGTLTWGDGAGARDTTLYREGANALRTDDGFKAATISVADEFTLPSTDGADQQVLATNGAGTVEWRTITPPSIAFTVPGPITFGTGKSRWYAATDMTISNIRVSVDTAPVGADIIVDVNKNGTTIFTNQANRPRIIDGQYTDFSNVPDVTALTTNDYITIDIDQIGVSEVGKDLVLQIDFA